MLCQQVESDPFGGTKVGSDPFGRADPVSRAHCTSWFCTILSVFFYQLLFNTVCIWP